MSYKGLIALLAGAIHILQRMNAILQLLHCLFLKGILGPS